MARGDVFQWRPRECWFVGPYTNLWCLLTGLVFVLPPFIACKNFACNTLRLALQLHDEAAKGELQCESSRSGYVCS